MTKKIQKVSEKKQLTLEGMMTLGKNKEGLRTADFACCERVEIERFEGLFKVDGMHDGNIYMVEKPKRKRNHPIFREDNMALSHGKDGYWYVSFRIADEELELLPMKLTKQSASLAKKVRAMLDVDKMLG